MKNVLPGETLNSGQNTARPRMAARSLRAALAERVAKRTSGVRARVENGAWEDEDEKGVSHC